MQFALVDGSRSIPTRQALGNCPYCGGRVNAKCGEINAWHWAHSPKRACDPWWENETIWHREWKSFFPEHCRERVFENPLTGEKHVADVQNLAGRVVEFQNSPMPTHELESREEFYGDMIWIVNGNMFEKNFRMLSALPDPTAEFVQDLVFFRQTSRLPAFCYWRRSENPNPKPDDMFLTHFVDEDSETGIRNQINEHYVGHHMFDWKHPRTVWLESNKPVYFDFGLKEHLVKLGVYQRQFERDLPFAQYVSKRELIESIGGKWMSVAIEQA
jgi:competence protein CoiA